MYVKEKEKIIKVKDSNIFDAFLKLKYMEIFNLAYVVVCGSF